MLGWVVAAVAAGWGALAVVVGVVLGRVVRVRERQVPHHPRRPVPPIPRPRAPMDPAVERDREPG